jgi:hypothetical protein
MQELREIARDAIMINDLTGIVSSLATECLRYEKMIFHQAPFGNSLFRCKRYQEKRLYKFGEII